MPYQPQNVKRSNLNLYKRLLRSKEWKMLRAQVLLEETDCARCDLEVDKQLSGNEPLGPNVDHKIPFSERPDLFFDRTNVRLTHKRCNQEKDWRWN